MSIPLEAVLKLHDTIRVLVREDFELLEADGRAGRLTASQLREAIHRYGRHLVDVPIEEIIKSHFYLLEGVKQKSWIIEVDLWTTEEGKSDLTLSVLVTMSSINDIQLEITDLHVL
ncbi:DUF7668 domain-containing protein [Tuwongella immobilis]|uniref:DUF7668 domain-containing protein n=1 Tax=Tuwongella immobilis TaxID=692036 RepID=UPI0013A698EC|nr:hypothetical protein [Tuwongella immobilis]